jgi:hypothetical protein
VRRLARFVLGLLLAAALAAPAWAAPPIWRVKRGQAEVVLFGSIHVLSEGLGWRTPALEAALAGADEVWFEIPIDPQARAQSAASAARRGMLPPGVRLTGLLPREGRALLARTAARLNLPMTQLDRLRPWFAEAVVSLADLQQRGGRTSEGVEEQLAARAPPDARRRAFETPDEQIAILAGQSTREQVASLMETLRQIETEPESFTELQAAWIKGDVAWIEREALAPMRKETPALYRALVIERNRRWAATIRGLLEGRSRTFVVVGVGHLVGSESVPALLRRQGLQVEGP